MRIRLQAEAKQEQNPAWPDDFDTYRNDAELQTILEAQMRAFLARRRNIDTDVATLQEGINALEARIEASKMRMSNVERAHRRADFLRVSHQAGRRRLHARLPRDLTRSIDRTRSFGFIPGARSPVPPWRNW